MSIVTVQLFAAYADLLGRATLDVPLGHGDTVGDLVRSIRSLPGASALPETPLVAVNRDFAAQDVLIRTSDEIALIPPMAGG